METRGIVVDHNRGSGDVTIYAATQAPHEVRAYASRLLGIPEHHVRVIMRDTGGGFGQKVMVMREDMCLMLAALHVPAPVKWVEDRQENLVAAGQSRHEHATSRMAFDESGVIQAARIDFVEDCGAYPVPFPVGVAMTVGALFPGPYRVPRATFTTKSIYTNTAGRTAYRGPWVFESLARELLLDKAAREIGIDPIELRRRNLLRADDQPYANPNGMTFDRISPLETLEKAVEVLDYDGFRHEQAEARTRGRYLGVGTCTYVEPTTPGAGVYGTEGATIRIEPSGRVNVYLSGGSAGNSLETTVVQLTADALGVDIDDVATIQGDTAITPFGAGTGGSRSGSMTAGAVGETASILRDRIVAIAAHRLEAAPDDIELAESRASVRGTPAKGITLAEIAALAYFQPDQLPPDVPPGLEASGRYKAASRNNWANATHVCTCEVDLATGQGHAAPLHRGRGLRPDDQPERRRRPGLRRHRPGHRRRAVRTPRVRRDRQPRRHDVHGLLGSHCRRDPAHRDRARRHARSRPGWLQGRRRRWCARRRTRGGQRGCRRARALGRRREQTAAHTVGDPRTRQIRSVRRVTGPNRRSPRSPGR